MKPSVAVSTTQLQSMALQVGLDQLGISSVASPEHSAFYLQWLQRGMHGEMHFMESHAQLRIHPEKLLRGAASILCFAWNYNPPPTDALPPSEGAPLRGVVARYARGLDYHPLFKQRMHAFWDLVCAQVKTKGVRARFFTDSAPLLERDLAARSGVGWIGKNCCLIHPKLGSWLFLGEIITNLELDLTPPMVDRCGSCTACLDACPTQALRAPYTLDANRCIAYLTIEKRSAHSEWEAKQIDHHLFGCDICQEVCPWNRRSPLGSFFATGLRQELLQGDLDALACADPQQFQHRFADSPVSRATHVGWQRNLETVRRNHRGKKED